MDIPFAWKQQWTNDLFSISTPIFIFLTSITPHQKLLYDHHIKAIGDTKHQYSLVQYPQIQGVLDILKKFPQMPKTAFCARTAFVKVNIRSGVNCCLCHQPCIQDWTAALIGEKGETKQYLLQMNTNLSQLSPKLIQLHFDMDTMPCFNLFCAAFNLSTILGVQYSLG